MIVVLYTIAFSLMQCLWASSAREVYGNFWPRGGGLQTGTVTLTNPSAVPQNVEIIVTVVNNGKLSSLHGGLSCTAGIDNTCNKSFTLAPGAGDLVYFSTDAIGSNVSTVSVKVRVTNPDGFVVGTFGSKGNTVHESRSLNGGRPF